MNDISIRTHKGPNGWMSRIFFEDKPISEYFGPFPEEQESEAAALAALESHIAKMTKEILGLSE